MAKRKYHTNIKELRIKRGFTQQQLGQQFRKPVDLTVISRWERGIVRPSSENLLELARALHVHPEQFIFIPIETDLSVCIT